MDVGCETGKNAICLIQAGHNVTLIDIAPNAIRYTQENLKKMKLDHGVIDRITGKIESLDSKYSPFKAVIGTYVFSYIAPGQFQQVMQENVLGRIEPGGYFAGGFFGGEHAWAKKPELSILTPERLRELFESNGFSICAIEEKKEEQSIISCGQQMFHTFEVIAQKHCNYPKWIFPYLFGGRMDSLQTVFSSKWSPFISTQIKDYGMESSGVPFDKTSRTKIM